MAWGRAMDDPRLAALALAVPGTLLHLAIVGVLLRLTHQRFGMPIFAGVALALLLAGVALFGASIAFWHFAAFFGGGVALVVFLYGAVLKSLSLAMLAELEAAPEQTLPLAVLAQRIVEPAFAERAGLLVEMGAAAPDGAGYALTPKGLATSGRIQAARRFLRVETLGLYGGGKA
jgi:hypothetical protein